MRVAIASQHFHPAHTWGGPVRSLWNLARGLAAAGVEVHVVTTIAEQQGLVSVVPERREEGVTIRTLSVLGDGKRLLMNRFALAPGITRALWSEIARADIVYLGTLWGTFTPAAMVVARVLRKPYVLAPRGMMVASALARKARRKRYALSFGFGSVLRRSAALHFTTEQERRESLCGWTRTVDTFVVPNAVDIHDFERRRQPMRGDGVRIGIFGRIHPVKGFEIALGALARTRREDIEMVIVGPDEAGHRAEVEMQAQKLGVAGQIQFVGALKGCALQQAYADVDILIMPSHHENFGNVVPEAAAQGTPCIVSDRCGVAGWVANEDVGEVLPLEVGAWAKIFDELDAAKLQKRWPREKLRAAVENNFSMPAVARQMIDAYEKILAGQPPEARSQR